VLTTRDAVGQRSETVRRANLSTIVQELHLRGPLSRSDLVARTGLTRSTIRGLIGELAAGELVTEVPSMPDGAPGRPSPIVHPNADAAVVLALEINVDSLAAALVGFGGTVHRLTRVDRPRGHLSVDAILDDLHGLATPMLAAAGASLIGVGVAVAGIVRRSDGHVRMAPNLGWREEPLAARVRDVLGVEVPVWVANEADLGGLAEHRRGAARGEDSVLSVMGEVGVGGNLIVDGRPVLGAAGYAGEVGHMPVNAEGELCACGSRGCWETEIGERALLARAGRSPDGGREGIDDLVAAAEAGNEDALASLRALARWLGIGLAALVNVLNPGLVVLGGLFERVHPLIADGVEETLGARALPPSRELIRVVPGTLGADAPLLGAAELALEPLLSDPAAHLGVRPALAAMATA
jgi:predicted NBD/HSP70 family sugar kinase